MTSASRGPALQVLLSDHIVAIEDRIGEIDESLLWPEERDALGNVIEGRRRDYVLGRRCARTAIEALGLRAFPILAGEARQPLWPPAVVGSITHTRGYIAAAVARVGDTRAVGIDAEPDEPLPAGVLDRVSRDEERDWLRSDPGQGVMHGDRLLFSAKEAVYKAWYPLMGRWLGFADASIRIDSATGTFIATIVAPDAAVEELGIAEMRGRYRADGGIILTAVEIA